MSGPAGWRAVQRRGARYSDAASVLLRVDGATAAEAAARHRSLDGRWSLLPLAYGASAHRTERSSRG